MKRLLSFGLFFLALSPLARGAINGPITEYFPNADTVYLVRVTSTDNGKVTFSVTEALRGNPITVLILTSLSAFEFKPDSEWLLASYGPERIGGRKDEVGWLLKGGLLGWLPARVVRVDNEIYVQTFDWESDHLVEDKAADGTTGLTLEHIKRLLQQRPYKP